jgi:hypothetical protein
MALPLGSLIGSLIGPSIGNLLVPRTFYSKTQSQVASAPLIVTIVAVVIASGLELTDLKTGAIWFGTGFAGSLIWGWMLLSSYLNRRGITSMLGIGYSKNLSPSRAEEFVRKLNFVIAGAVAAGMVVLTFLISALRGDKASLVALLSFGALSYAMLAFFLIKYLLSLLEVLVTWFHFRPVKDQPTRV